MEWVDEIINYDNREIAVLVKQIRGGLVSRNEEVAGWTIRLIVRLDDGSGKVFKEVVQDYQTLQAVLMGMDRH